MNLIEILEDRLASSISEAVSYARILPWHIRHRVAPHLPEPDRSNALRFADSLRPECACAMETEQNLLHLLNAIADRIEAGSTMEPTAGSIGQDYPALVARLDSGAVELRKVVELFADFHFSLSEVQDLAASIQIAADLRRA